MVGEIEQGGLAGDAKLSLPRFRRRSKRGALPEGVDASTRTGGQAPGPEAPAVVPTPAPPARQAKALRPRRPLRFPRLHGWFAALVTGMVVGLVGVTLIRLGARGCDAARGTDSCGGAGLLLLIAIVSAMVLLGARLQRVWSVPDPVNSSFLAVGLVAVIVMLFLLDHQKAWWMWVVVPALSATSYVVSWWVTTTFIDRDQLG